MTVHVTPLPNPQGEKNTCWDDLHGMYHGAQNLINEVANISSLLRNKEMCEKVSDLKGLADDATSINANLIQMKTELNTIYADHKGLSGGTECIDMNLASIMIGEKYNNWTQRFQLEVAPVVQRILSRFSEEMAA